MFNFFELYWCGFRGSNIALFIFYIIAIFLIFKYTAIAVDEYIAEGITQLSEYLGMSEALAAVTLLAFANGAGDVITALVASGTEGGISYNIGALFGAGVFVCTIVVAICIYQSEDDIVFDKMIIYRDIGIYLIATLATVAFAIYGKITWWNSTILLLLYVALVLVVVIEERSSPIGKEE
jgi:sodium/potassium/calcium exchanger 6